MIENTAGTANHDRRANQQILKITEQRIARRPSGRRDENPKSIEQLREIFVQVDPVGLTAEANLMMPPAEAHRIDGRKVVLHLRLIGERCRPDLKARSGELELIDVGGDVAVRPNDPQVVAAHDLHVVEVVADVHVTEARLVHPPGAEHVRLAHREESVVHRQKKREVQVERTDPAAEFHRQTAAPKGEERGEIGPKESSQHAVAASAEIAIQVQR